MLIAVDASGGDYAPQEVVKGSAKAAKEYNVQVALVGSKSILEKLAKRHEKTHNLSIVHASQTISCNEHPVEAIKAKTDSSIVVGTRMVKEGVASAFVSAGSTGAVLTAAFTMLNRLPAVYRPALATVIAVNPASPFVLVDAGANADCLPAYLVQFAQMGSIFASGHLGMASPRVALLNNGEEEVKGNRLARESHQLLKAAAGINFIGNVEPQEILNGKADVIVTDGFTGNIVLKALEGFGETFGKLLGPRQSYEVPRGLQGVALAQYTQATSMVKRADYKEFGGACLLGLDGNVIVAHGRSNAKAIKSAIHLAAWASQRGVVDAIKTEVGEVREVALAKTGK